ncbi:MAG TPA: prefoldin subunit beta [Candidatus Nanoarchaeia archaeon]|nr:prefoldin subunit beta [Candidatus Nanoarchaeia archaeon]
MESNAKIQELQFLEQNIQNLIFQKQAFQLELSETDSALNEINNAGEEVFKIIGQLMIKTKKSKVKEELENKKKILEMRIKTIEKQESSFAKKIEEIQEQIVKLQEKK